ncbi:Rhodanese-like protein [Metschnikowia bicuspidata var. bicuspidata NRRL YB-4993]|uniref:Sulfurtransferase n=1 Tax=Metschnikowia bicuspidata var. bicuspidata NRRL YB-4993 TaxID=869754 RepID=A0A1A0H9G1_9ASCO|nr:Rhodanese-like protein [Metschnikowia bicuspidata var. bicuspidata NRRL YB-4993]OBA20759.1 Rhodanese-like protein [Metschnikowia bicuspidata var. bicuspidata NRRL YB-4993]
MALNTSPLAKIVSPNTASKLLAGPARVVPVDATWYMPNSPHNAREQFQNEDRIPGSVFFDLDKVCSSESPYPHMLPLQSVFNSAMAQLGIRKADHVLVYDRSGIFSGPRAAWTLSLFGHENVYLLDHYKQFKEDFGVEQRKLLENKKLKMLLPSTYEGVPQELFSRQYKAQVMEFEELRDLVVAGKLADKYYAFDARAKGRFTGEDPEPRKGLSSGHVPGSMSLPFPKVLNAKGHYKSREELIQLFQEEYALDLTLPLLRDGILVMCGTGVTAVILQMAIHKVSADIPVRVYDGSWTEWAQRAPELIKKS